MLQMKALGIVGTAWTLALIPASVFAQNASASQAVGNSSGNQAASLEEIVVTGTHISREGYDAPTPTTVVGSQLLETRAPSVLIDALKLLPSFRNSSTPTTAGTAGTGSGGESFANLRGLGPNRTLVLLNGQRIVPTTATGTIDVALLPSALIQRVDVVTGGASSVYGSDAVAGVVNLVLDNNLEGLKSDFEVGTSFRGDDTSQKAQISWGDRLTDRLHLIASGEYYHSGGVDPDSRDWAKDPVQTITNPAYVPGNGQPAVLLTKNVYLANSAFGGVITNGPLRGTEFLPGGATTQYDFCQFSNAAGQLCSSKHPNLGNLYEYMKLASPQERELGYSRLTFEASPNVKIYADELYGQSNTTYTTIPYASAFFGGIPIQRDNAFLPVSIASQMDALGETSFTLGRFSRDNGPGQFDRRAIIERFSAGVEAEVSKNWKLSAYATHGESHQEYLLSNTPDVPLFRAAVDSVTSLTTGRPICRSALTNPTTNCVPANVFGGGSTSPQSTAYYLGTSRADLTSTQTALAVNLAGQPFSTWADTVSVAVGGEVRWDSARQTVDSVSLARGFLSNPQPLDGSLNVKEAYAETVVPLAKDMSFAKELELSGAARLTDYSRSGRVVTWKLGGNYSPISGIRLRSTISRDIRAPNITELFTRGVQVSQTVFDRLNNNQQVIVQNIASGNPDLQPEKADTTALGLVLQPVFLPALNFSVDYYRIKIDGAIQTLATQDIVDRCAAGTQNLCELITRDSAGQITTIRNPFLNVAQLTTSGIDFDVSYGFQAAGGRVNLRAMGNHMGEYIVNDGRTRLDEAGDISNFDLPKWSADLSAEYSRGGTTILLDASYIGSGNFSNTLIGRLTPNDVQSTWYLNGTIQHDVKIGGTQVQIYLNGTNLFDQKPPFGLEHQGANYDRVGRALKIGVRVSM
jgi:iron complex outermembrane recepter protein